VFHPAGGALEPLFPVATEGNPLETPALDRRLCRSPDCADLDTTCVAQREIPTGDIGAILSGCPAALLRLGAIAGRICVLLPRSSAPRLE